ncbi:MAG: hypothetical protein ACI8XO_002216 [Verrucomicrobiales bacterium]|jgi:hypothetical protein
MTWQRSRREATPGVAKDSWDGIYSKKIVSAVSSEQLETIVGPGRWRIDPGDEKPGKLVFIPKRELQTTVFDDDFFGAKILTY